MYNFDMRKKGFSTALEEEQLCVLDSHTFVMSPTHIQSSDEFKEQIKQLGDDVPTAYSVNAIIWLLASLNH